MTELNNSHDHSTVRTVVRHCDVAIIGGSAAGLAAALQLTRQQRSVLVIDDGSPRNAPAAHMHGYLGREGSPPEELRAVGRDEVRGYGGEILAGHVLAVRREDDGFHLHLSGGHTVVARRVLAATGIIDEIPDIVGLQERWGREVIHCPFCHGFEVRDLRVVQLVTTPVGLHPASLMRHLTARLTVVVHDADGIDPAAIETLAASGVPVIVARVHQVTAGSESPLVVELADGRSLTADAVLTGARFHARAEMLEGVGVVTVPHASGLGDIVAVDPTGRTAVDGVFAAGNLSDPGLQVLSAAANGGWVGAQIAFSLAADDVKAHVRPSAVEHDWDRRYAEEERMWSANPNGTMVAEMTAVPPGRALDIGAGEGADALWLAERGWKATASDISGTALARIREEAKRRGVAVDTIQGDANELDPYGRATYDLVSMQYGSFHRTPDQRGLRSLLGAVAVEGTLLVVSHDLAVTRQHGNLAEQSQMYDPDAFVGIDEIAAALDSSEVWRVDLHETRRRPAGAITSHHVDDVVLRAVRLAADPTP